ncbi:MAG TPA: protein tyrosine phosphatase family protein [Candidatus Binatia bacterium]|nr:protein tyrosine phosphatase family protein [Candidatus Binatia bacterium]
MNKIFAPAVAMMFLCAVAGAAEILAADRSRLDRIQQYLKNDVPRVLCLDDNFSTGGQPTNQAYAKVAASGFQSVLSLRVANEGVDLFRERASVEQNKMRYFNIPVVSSAPRAEQADEFIRLVKNSSNHPMLINCASANRVGAFMMIYRVLEQHWSEDKALEEAVKIGLTGEHLKKFARDYIARHKQKRG